MKMMLASLMLAALARAGEVKVAWDANPEPNVTGYEVRAAEQWGTHEVKVKTSTLRALIADLKPGVTYLIQARAENSHGLLSAYCEPILYTTPAEATYTLQKSLGMDAWEDRASLVADENDLAVKLFEALLPQLIKDAKGERGFFRVKKEVLP